MDEVIAAGAKILTNPREILPRQGVERLPGFFLSADQIFTLPSKDYSAGKHKRIGRYPIQGEITAYS